MKLTIKLIATTALISLSSCEEKSPETKTLTQPQEEALQDFQNAGEVVKENYKVEVKRAEINWETKTESEESTEKIE